MLQEEVNLLLSKIENELLEFVSFIKNVEEEYNSSFYGNFENRDASGHKKTLQNISVDGDNRQRCIALTDAFNIVRNVLLKISALIDVFASLPTEDEGILKDSDNYMVSYYYLQYVYQIASYLVKTVEEHLGRFSERLGQLSSPKPQIDNDSFESPQQKEIPVRYKSRQKDNVSFDPRQQRKITLRYESRKKDDDSFESPQLRKIPVHYESRKKDDDSFESPQLRKIPVRYESRKKDDDSFESPQLRKIPVRCESQQKEKLPECHFKFKYSKPATVFTRDDKVYEHPRHYKFIHKRPPRMISSDVPESSIEDESESLDHFLSEKGSLIYTDKFRDKTDKILSKITNVVNALEVSVSVALELLQQLKSNSFTKHMHTQTPTQKRRFKRTIPHNVPRSERTKTGSFYCDCCDSCKEKHWMYQNEAMYESDERGHSSSNELYPNLNTEPRWMNINPANINTRNLSPSAFRADNEKCKEMSCSTKGLSYTPIKVKDMKQKAEASLQRSHNDKDHITKMPANTRQLQTYDVNKDASSFTAPRDCDNKLQIEANGTFYNVDKIVPSSKQRKQISTGELKPRQIKKEGTKEKEHLEKETRKPVARMKSPTSVLMSMVERFPLGMTPFKTQDKRLSESDNETEFKIVKDDTKQKKAEQASADSGKKPNFNRDHKHCNRSKQGGQIGICCLHPQAKHQTTTTPETNILIDKSIDEEEEYPQAVMFDLNKFSFTLKDKFASHLRSGSEMTEKLELRLIWDMIFDSMEEATNFFEQKEEAANGKKDLPQDKSTVTDRYLDRKTDEAVDSVVKNVSDTATQVTCETEDDDNDNKSEDIPFSRACILCLSMIESSACEYEQNTAHQKCLAQKSLKRRCFKCGNKRERGLTIHQCHDFLPSGVLEVRHMGKHGKICVCYLFWRKQYEVEDWRWQKNPFRDPTRVEVVQETTEDSDAVLKVIYGPEGCMVKESLAETRLQIVSDVPKIDIRPKVKSSASAEAVKSASTSWLKLHRKKKNSIDGTSAKMCMFDPLINNSESSFSLSKQNLITKLGRLFDDIQKVGYGKGPPLILKIRRNAALHDAYDLLMAPSKVPLNYYRSLRVIYIEDFKSKVHPSSSNFIQEDESEELFNLFARMLFSASEKRLFEHPSEETQCLYLNPYSNSHPQWFAFAGTVLALAFLHQKKMNIKLPLCLFKCLLDRSMRIDDLKEIDPMFHQKLMWMKENDITSRKMKMTFMIKEEMGNNTYEKELLPNGREIAVTEKNKFRYIDLVVKWKLAERCLSQLKDFRCGFSSVLNPCFLTTFSEKELQSLIRQPLGEEIFLNESASTKNVTQKITRRNTD